MVIRYALGNYTFGVFIEPNNEKLKERFEYATKQKKEGGLCVPSTIEIELESNVFMRTDNKTVQENLKKYYNEAIQKNVIDKVPARFSVNVDSNTDKWTEADIMGGLRQLKTSGYHKSSKI